MLSLSHYDANLADVKYAGLSMWGLGMREPGHIKRAPRVDTHIDAALTDSDGSRMEVIVLDISREGCRLETDGTLKIGEKIELHVPRYGTYPAQVRWAVGNEAGAVFLEPVILT